MGKKSRSLESSQKSPPESQVEEDQIQHQIPVILISFSVVLVETVCAANWILPTLRS